ncbi:hypothetical protein GTQ40_11630 [Flavobacteriaceae bacterium R38]|nr:hypothetical protein [Flavobacteriaceae bacterium R38]
MFKKIFLVGILNLFSQGLSFVIFSWIAKLSEEDFISTLGVVDSYMWNSITLVSFGIIQIATRDIVLSENWSDIIKKTQATKLSMGLLIMLFGIIAFGVIGKDKYLILLLVPFFSLSLDYALIARGKVVQAALLGFIRTLLPITVLLICIKWEVTVSLYVYIFSLGISFFVYGLISSIILKIRYFYIPNKKFFIEYLKNFRIGLMDFSIIFLQLGIISFADFFYEDKAIANAFLVLKLYYLFKGVQRIIFQTFYKDLLTKNTSFFVNFLELGVSNVFFIGCFIFPETLINLFYDNNYIGLETSFKLIGLAGLIASLASFSPRLMLMKKEKECSNVFILALIFNILFCILFSYYFENQGILLSIIISEIVLTTGFIFHLFKYVELLKIVKLCILYFVFICFAFIIKGFTGDHFLGVLLSVLSVGLMIVYFLFRKKEIFLELNTKN